MPVFQTAMYVYGGRDALAYDAIPYIRLNNTPNHQALHAKIANLEGAEDALVAASGMAAISATFLALAGAGDHILVQDCLYGGTSALVSEHLRRLGIEATSIDATEPGGWERALRPNTRAIYVESLTNPLLDVADLPAVADFSRAHGLVSVVDNTFATPVNLRPIELGFDLVVHSATKYLNGHSDIVAGAVAGSRALVTKVTHVLNHFGGTLDPHACFLLHRGLKTLAVRVREQNRTAQKLAERLAAHDIAVRYPGLPSHPGHERARAIMSPGFGGMLSFELGGDAAAAERFIDALTLPVVAPSLGGIESLVTRPAISSHAAVPAAERARMGVTDALIRLSVGIEDSDDLCSDVERALSAAAE
jgi:cystathionine gamma-synthase/cystathionine gamma-lyase/cystathionine beta-lyase